LFFTSLIGLFLAVVYLVGCNGLAAPEKPSGASIAESRPITMADRPVRTVQASYRAANMHHSSDSALDLTSPTTKAVLSISSRPAPLQIMTDALPEGTMQGNYATALVATGGVPPYSWDDTAGQIAPGLTLRSSTGTISGIPFEPGAFSFTARVRDSGGSSLSTNISLRVSSAPSSKVSDVPPDTLD
jgi:hypothetical protein